MVLSSPDKREFLTVTSTYSKCSMGQHWSDRMPLQPNWQLPCQFILVSRIFVFLLRSGRIYLFVPKDDDAVCINLVFKSIFIIDVQVRLDYRGLCRFAAIIRSNWPSRPQECGAKLAWTPAERLATRITAQRNRSYKYSQTDSCAGQMRSISRNRSPTAHHASLKIATKPDLTVWVYRFRQNINRQHQARRLSDALSHALFPDSKP